MIGTEGREPTEPTDAMILAAKIYEWQAKQKYGEETLLHVAVLCDFTGASRYKRAMAEVIEQHMMSGARPMPDTPAPDEVAQLRAEVLRVTHAYEQVCMGIQKLRDAADLSTARVAELEALLAWLLWHQQGGHSVFGQPIRKALGLGQFERMPDAVIDIAKQFETTQPGPLEHTEAAPGKEPTSE